MSHNRFTEHWKEEGIVRFVWLILVLVAVCDVAGATIFDRVMAPVNRDASDSAVCLVSLFYLE